jgi:hypothetical protein
MEVLRNKKNAVDADDAYLKVVLKIIP